MRFLFASSLIGLCLASCAGAPPPVQLAASTYPSRGEVSEPAADGWTPGEVLIRKPSILPSEPPTVVRTGTTPNGFKYSYYKDGSGSIQKPGSNNYSDEWSINCTRDKMTDQRMCTISGGVLIIGFSSQGTPVLACSTGNDFPGRTGAIRINKGAPIRTDTKGCVSGANVAAVLHAKSLTLRWVHWPYDFPVDGEQNTAGLTEAVALVAYILKNVDKVAF